MTDGLPITPELDVAERALHHQLAAMHAGTGAPAGPVTTSGDTITINNPLGVPAEKSIKDALKNRPRVTTYTPPGMS